MKTTTYNPSKLELEFSAAIESLLPIISAKLPDYKISVLQVRNNLDNPFLDLSIEDADGDLHELVIKFVQRPDK
jgi:hypothetical protein